MRSNTPDYDTALDEVRAGRTLWHVLREPGERRPEATSWYKKLKRDPEFRAAAAEALEIGRAAREADAWTGRFECSEDVDEYLGGHTIRCLLCLTDGFRTLGQHLVSEHGTTAAEYRKRFGIPAGRALATSASSARMRARPNPGLQVVQERYRERRAGIDWDAAIEKIAAGSTVKTVCTGTGVAPSPRLWRSRRAADPLFVETTSRMLEGRNGGRVRAETLGVVIERMAGGESLRKAVVGLPVSADTVHNVRARNSAFAERLGEILSARRRIRQPRIEPIRPNAHLEAFRTNLRQNEIYAVVDRALPRWMTPQMREDVRSEAILAVLECQVTEADVSAIIKRCVRDYGRMYDGYAASLDAPIGDGGFTLGNSLAAAYI